MATTPSVDANATAHLSSLDSKPATHWHSLAEQVLGGKPLSADQAKDVLLAHDDDLLDILSASFRVRREHFGRRVQLYFLMNAKSGLCPEDCTYCSQSKDSKAEIPKYNLLSRDKLLDGARIAKEQDAQTYCIVISARGPSEREIEAMEAIVPEIKQQYGLHICACLGLLTPEHASRLKACGVDRVNHNLNTSPEYYQEICTTHSYEDRVDTLRAVREAGMELCSGGIIGMGERPEDVVQMAFELRDQEVQSIPLNFLISIDGTPLESRSDLTPRYCLRALAMFRLVNPSCELRIAGGREPHLGSLQALGLYPANSIFVGDYLTTQGQAPQADFEMIEQMGFEVVHGGC